MADLTLLDTTEGIAVGMACALLVGPLSAAVTLRWRAHTFAHYKNPDGQPPAWFPAITAPARNIEDRQCDEALRQVLASAHGRAKHLQDKTVAQLIASSMTLLGAFIVTALTVTLWREAAQAHIVSASFDVVALVYAYLAFLRSGQHRTAWLRQRATSELLRQWCTVDYILAPPGSDSVAYAETLVSGWDQAISKDPATLIDCIGRLAYARIDELTAALATVQIPDAALRTHYVAREQRQARWFSTSLERLKGSHRRRTTLMTATFFGAAGAACVKFAALLLHTDALSQIALLVVLVCIGLAGASSSAYLGQNQRSVKHRYVQQLRAMEQWVQQSKRDGLVLRLQGGGAAPDAVVRDIRAFELLMAAELLDWLAISTDDAMELAPS